jgi:hypothetical protein
MEHSWEILSHRLATSDKARSDVGDVIGLVSKKSEESEETHRAQGKENSPGRKAVHDTEKQRLRSDDGAAENQEHRRAPKDTKDGGRGNWE